MNSDLLLVVIFSLIGGVISLSAAALLITRQKTALHMAEYATPFAAGALLAAAFADLLTEGIHEAGFDNFESVLLAALAGILLFFFLERFLHWFHHHHEHGYQEGKAKNSLVIIGDTLHNALDGIAIGAAFLIDPSVGIVATIAVAAHEIPQEIGDFGILLKNGMNRRKVLLVNVISALATTITAVGTYLLGDSGSLPTAALLGLTAGFFIYIAASDIIPEIHDRLKKDLFDIRPILLLIGALFVLAVNPIAHRYIEADNNHDHESSQIEHSDDANHSEDEESPHSE